MAKSTNMLAALCLPKMPKLNGNNYRMYKIEFLRTPYGIHYALTAEEAPEGSKSSYEKNNKTCCG